MDDFITEDEAAAIARKTPQQMRELRYKGGGPVFYKPTARSVLYKRDEVIGWIEGRAHARTDRPIPASA